jgi:protocatechuate 3,4-dioxygenase beta subunit
VGFVAPNGYAFTLQNQGGNAAADSDADGSGRTAPFAITSGQTDATRDAGIYQTATLGDRAWVDTDGNGIQDGGESGLAGVTVKLYDTGDILKGTTTTDANGIYTFTVAPGQYYVHFTTPNGYTLTARAQGSNGAADSDADPATGRTPGVTLATGQSNLTVDAGFYQPVTIGDRIWVDTNADGIQGAESGLAGVAVALKWAGPDGIFGNGDDTTALTTTNASGIYTFSNRAPGSYYLTMTVPSGYFLTPLDQGGNDALDSDFNPATARTAQFAMTSSQSDLTWDGGLYQKAAIGDRVWVDSNGDGLQDGGEPGLANVTVELYDTLGGAQGSTTTDANGIYTFTGVIPGSYDVKFVLLGGYVFSPRHAGTDPALDSDPDLVTGQASLTVASGVTDLTWDAGLIPTTAVVGNLVWHDLNANGVQDGGEPGLNGVSVALYRADSSLFAITTTSASGIYTFTNVPAGTFYVTFTAPSGYIFSPPGAGTTATDSNANPATGKTANFSLLAGQTVATIDAGLYQTGSLGDRVWVDRNGDGIQDAGEVGLAGVTVKLFDGVGAQVGSDTATDASGLYTFTVTPGTYSVKFTAPGGYTFTLRNQGTSANDSDPDLTGRTADVTIASGEANPTIDAGLYQPAAIGNYVWYDANGDGLQDGGERGIAGVTVRIFTGGGANVLTTTTDASGLYTFTVTPGTYYVNFTVPGVYTFTLRNQGTGANDSDADPATGRTADVTIASGEVNQTIDAGLYLRDFGDLPAAYAMTTLAQDGARHIIGDLYLGARVDAEANGTPSDTATASSDDDGIERSSQDTWDPASTVHLTATVHGSGGYLVGWFDWNGNQSLGDAGELVRLGSVISGMNRLTMTIAAASVVRPVFVRFRLYAGEPTSPLPTGQVVNGEVEDYRWSPVPTAVRLISLSAGRAQGAFWGGCALALLAMAGLAWLRGALLNFFRQD